MCVCACVRACVRACVCEPHVGPSLRHTDVSAAPTVFIQRLRACRRAVPSAGNTSIWHAIQTGTCRCGIKVGRQECRPDVQINRGHVAPTNYVSRSMLCGHPEAILTICCMFQRYCKYIIVITHYSYIAFPITNMYIYIYIYIYIYQYPYRGGLDYFFFMNFSGPGLGVKGRFRSHVCLFFAAWVAQQLSFLHRMT